MRPQNGFFFFSENAGAIGAMDKTKRVAREPAPTVTGTKQARARERGRERERERERDRERDRRKTEANPREQAFQKYENKPYAKIFSGSYFAKLRKQIVRNTFSENYLRKITHWHVSPEKITQNNFQRIFS